MNSASTSGQSCKVAGSKSAPLGQPEEPSFENRQEVDATDDAVFKANLELVGPNDGERDHAVHWMVRHERYHCCAAYRARDTRADLDGRSSLAGLGSIRTVKPSSRSRW